MSKLVHVVFREEFFQGEFIERELVGVFSSPELADEAVYDLESAGVELYDPTARTVYTVAHVELDQILEQD